MTAPTAPHRFIATWRPAPTISPQNPPPPIPAERTASRSRAPNSNATASFHVQAVGRFFPVLWRRRPAGLPPGGHALPSAHRAFFIGGVEVAPNAGVAE